MDLKISCLSDSFYNSIATTRMLDILTATEEQSHAKNMIMTLALTSRFMRKGTQTCLNRLQSAPSPASLPDSAFVPCTQQNTSNLVIEYHITIILFFIHFSCTFCFEFTCRVVIFILNKKYLFQCQYPLDPNGMGHFTFISMLVVDGLIHPLKYYNPLMLVLLFILC